MPSLPDCGGYREASVMNNALPDMGEDDDDEEEEIYK